MKYIKSFNESLYSVRKEGIVNICKTHNIKKFTINPDMSIDVHGDVYLGYTLDSDSLPLTFNKIYGNFECCGDMNNEHRLSSLKGCPKWVQESFKCSNNELTSLEGCPKYVGGDFDCSYNQLTTLKGCPENILYSFECANNKLTSLEYAPKNISNKFICSHNELNTLEGFPDNIGSDFSCSHNELYNLNGMKFNIEGDITIDYNPISLLINFIRQDITYKDVDFPSLVYRIDEFEVISGEKVDIIHLEQLYDFYNKELNKDALIERISNYYETI